MPLSLKYFFLNFAYYSTLSEKENVLSCKKGVNFIYYVHLTLATLLNYFSYVFIFKAVFFGKSKKNVGQILKNCKYMK